MNTAKQFLLLLSIVGVVGVMGNAGYAQSGHFSASSLSMGGTGAAYLDTYHANFLNPANLMLNSQTKPSISLGLLGGVSATGGGPLLNVAVYNEHFTSGDFVDADVALHDWFGAEASNSRRMGMELDIIPLGGAWRGDNLSISLALRNRTLFSSSVNRGYAEIMLTGITEERFQEPKPVNFSSEAIFFSEVSVGAAFRVFEQSSLLGFAENVKVHVGAAPKYIVPHHTSSFKFNSTLLVTENEVVHDFVYTIEAVGSLRDQFQEYSEARQNENFNGTLGDFVNPDGGDFGEVQGSGFGIDLGGTIEMDLVGQAAALFSGISGPKKLNVGLSVSDIGAVRYDKNAGSFSADRVFTWEGVDFDDGFDNALADSIANDIYLNYQPDSEERIVKNLPAKVHFGAHLQLGKLGFALDLTKGMNEAGMNSRRVALGLGAEYKLLNIIPLRGGFRTGGLTSSSITFGTGLELQNFELTVGVLAVPDSRKNGTGFGGAWSGLVVRF